MTLLHSILLGILQGLTEFLPVSSSGHLLLAEHLLGLKEVPLAYDVLLHTASLLAIIIYFRKIIATLFKALFNTEMKVERRLIVAVIVATMMTGLLMFPVKFLVDHIRNSIVWLSVTFSMTALILWVAQKKLQKRNDESVELTWKDAAIIGGVQAFALLPGISRSGSTLAAGLLRGAKGIQAMEFSFLLAIPAIVGATLLEVKDMGSVSIPLTTLLSGMFASFIFSLISLKLLDLLIKKMQLSLFSIYLVVVATTIPFLFL
ncbi:undecaprenyl-diphosphate phosphatase [bacterium]|nr:undecaprenyl-diphosphate phosphatase [bacterium]